MTGGVCDRNLQSYQGADMITVLYYPTESRPELAARHSSRCRYRHTLTHFPGVWSTESALLSLRRMYMRRYLPYTIQKEGTSVYHMICY